MMIKTASLPGTLPTVISMNRSIAEAAVPKMMNGMRLPILVSVRSDNTPNNGSMNSASTLSSAMITPVQVSPSPNV